MDEKLKRFLITKNYNQKIIDRGLLYLIPKWKSRCILMPFKIGYLIEEYRNDLALRHAIQEIVDHFTLTQGEVTQIYEIDQIFLRKTIPFPGSVLSKNAAAMHEINEQNNWYYYRALPNQINYWKEFCHFQSEDELPAGSDFK